MNMNLCWFLCIVSDIFIWFYLIFHQTWYNYFTKVNKKTVTIKNINTILLNARTSTLEGKHSLMKRWRCYRDNDLPLDTPIRREDWRDEATLMSALIIRLQKHHNATTQDVAPHPPLFSPESFPSLFVYIVTAQHSCHFGAIMLSKCETFSPLSVQFHRRRLGNSCIKTMIYVVCILNFLSTD